MSLTAARGGEARGISTTGQPEGRAKAARDARVSAERVLEIWELNG
jgi:hypothetical protein